MIHDHHMFPYIWLSLLPNRIELLKSKFSLPLQALVSRVPLMETEPSNPSLSLFHCYFMTEDMMIFGKLSSLVYSALSWSIMWKIAPYFLIQIFYYPQFQVMFFSASIWPKKWCYVGGISLTVSYWFLDFSDALVQCAIQGIPDLLL